MRFLEAYVRMYAVSLAQLLLNRYAFFRHE